MVRSKVCTGRSFDMKGRSFEYPSITEIHRFNDQSLTPYTGDTASFGFNTADPVEGGASLQCSAASNNVIVSQPGGGLNHYPSKGERWHIYLRCSQVGVTPNLVQRVRFGRADSNNFYQIQINWDDNDNWTLFKKTAGAFTTLDEDNAITGDLDPNTYYEIIVTWDDGSLGGKENDITAVLREVDGGTVKSTLFGNDSDHAGQSGVAFQLDNDNGATFDWDDFRLIEDTGIIIEDFERATPLADYTGDTGEFSITTTASEVFEGGAALKSTTTLGGPRMWAMTGLPYHPTRGDIFTVRLNPQTEDVSIAGFQFFKEASNSSSGYEVDVEYEGAAGGGTDITLIELNTQTILSSFNNPWEQDSWNIVEVDTRFGNEIVLSAYDSDGNQIYSDSAVDDTYNGSGFGWRGGSADGTAQTTLYDIAKEGGV